MLRVALRADCTLRAGWSEKVVVGSIEAHTQWDAALAGCDFVIHAAARAHVLDDAASNASLYLEANAEGTRSLAEAAARMGIRRLVFLSSIKVNGEATTDRPFHASDAPNPQDAYGMSKWLGEQHLMEIAVRTGMEAAIVRSPLVYGPGVRANFLRLLRWVDRGWPLPLGAVGNRRSLVSVWNLCDLIVALLHSPTATGRTWLVSDGEALSTPALIRRIAKAMGRTPWLVPVPPTLLKAAGVLARRVGEVERLCHSLEVDIGPTLSELGWSPRLTVDDSLARTVQWYLAHGGV